MILNIGAELEGAWPIGPPLLLTPVTNLENPRTILKLDNSPERLAELIESRYTHGYSLFQSKDIDSNQPRVKARGVESREVLNVELLSSSVGREQCCFLVWTCDSTHGAFLPMDAHQPWCPEFLLGLHDWLPTWPNLVSSPSGDRGDLCDSNPLP